MTTLDWHPLANAFPLIEGPQFDELVASIKANGLRHPIIVLDGLILDGRNRYRACEAAGIEPRFEQFTGSDPLAFVIDENLNRRHMNESQRAMAAAKLANMRLGDNQYTTGGSANLQTLVDAAQKMNVSPRSVSYARAVLNRGTPEDIRAVEEGRLSVSSVRNMLDRGYSSAERHDPTARNKRTKKNLSARNEALRARSALWTEVREALLHIGNLPAPADVAISIKSLGGPKRDRSEFLTRHLPISINWLTEFLNEWERKNAA